jgi:glutamine cyclotransferase
MARKKTQKTVILEHLERGKRLTNDQAERKGITNLSARIWELRHNDDVDISTDYKTFKSGPNAGRTVAYYYI